MKTYVVGVSALSLALGTLAPETSRTGSGQPLSLETSEPTTQAEYIYRSESSRPQPAGGVHTTYVLRSNDRSKQVAFNYNGTTGYNTPILAFASSGDGGFGDGYPSTNPWLISAGGTSILRNSNSLKVASESCWRGSGAAPARLKPPTSWTGGNTGPRSDYQYPIFGQTSRNTPDMSCDADSSSGA